MRSRARDLGCCSIDEHTTHSAACGLDGVRDCGFHGPVEFHFSAQIYPMSTVIAACEFRDDAAFRNAQACEFSMNIRLRDCT